MRIILPLLYLALVAGGALLVSGRSREEAFDYRATQALQRGHRVLASDLRLPDMTWTLAPALRPKSEYVGRYLDRNIAGGHWVRKEYLKERPTLTAAPGTVAHGWLLREAEKHWRDVLDVGWIVDLCDEQCAVTGSPVLAISCPGPEAGSCAVVLQLSPDQSKTLLAYRTKQKLNIIVGRVDYGDVK